MSFYFDVANKAGAIVFDPQNEYCQDGICYVIINGEPLYYDAGRPSLLGAALIIPPLVDIVKSTNEQHSRSTAPAGRLRPWFSSLGMLARQAIGDKIHHGIIAGRNTF